MRYQLPHIRAGQCVGLLGGSFDPPHEGHVHLTHQALKSFGLDHVWWLVTPQNPLKTHQPANLQNRLQAAQALCTHPHIKITGIEEYLGTHYTADTLAALRKIYPAVRFTWLMGADNLAGFHRWEKWKTIVAHHPVGVIARPNSQVQAKMSRLAHIFRKYQLSRSHAALLARAQPPAWCYVNMPLNKTSSTMLRSMQI